MGNTKTNHHQTVRVGAQKPQPLGIPMTIVVKLK